MVRQLAFLLTIIASIGSQGLYAQYIAYFEIKNQQRTGNTYEFDIYMQASPDSSYLSRGLMYVYYGTQAFGNSDPKTFVTPIHEDLIDDLAFGVLPKYDTNDPVQNGNRFAITLESLFRNTFPPDTTFHAMVPSTPTPMYHVSMVMVDTSKCPCVALDGNLMAGEQYYFNENFNPSLPVDTVSNPREIRYNVGILPAEIGLFQARLQENGQVALTWTTALEYQSAHFVVEKKTEYTTDFQPVAEVKASGFTETQTDYRYVDASPLYASKATYRLKQVNLDGSYKYSPVVEISIPLSDRIEVYPNPAEKEVYIEGYSGSKHLLTYTLSDLKGTTLLNRVQTLAAGPFSFPIDLQGLPSGTYMIRLENSEGESAIHKVVKK